MKQLSILDKIKVMFDLTKSNKLFILVIVLLVFLSIMFIATNKKNIKRNRKIFIGIYALVLVAIIIIYNEAILNMWDSMMNNLFIIFYFPNISVYAGAIIATNIIVLTSIFSKKTSKINKVVNSIVFFLLHYILVLILNVVSTNHLNVFNSKILYKNTDIHSLIELSGNIFIIWIIYLIIYKIINNYLISKKSTIVVEETVKVTEKVSKVPKYKVPKYVKVLKNPINIKQGSRFGDNVRIIDAPLTVKNIKTVKEEFMENVKSIKAPIIIKRKQPVTTYDLFKEEFMSNIKSVKAPVVIKRDYSFGGIRAINSPITIKNEGSIKEEFMDSIKSIKAPIIIKREEINTTPVINIVETKTPVNEITNTFVNDVTENNIAEEETYKPISRINNINIRPVFNHITRHNKTVLNTKNEINMNSLLGNNYINVLNILNKYKVNKTKKEDNHDYIEIEHRRKLSELMDLCGNN